MLLTRPILVFVAKVQLGEKLKSDCFKNACYLLIEYDVILLRRMSWPISSLLTLIFVMTGTLYTHTILLLGYAHTIPTQKSCF